MEREKKIEFNEYGIEFREDDFKNLTKEELEKCKDVIKKIKEKIEKK